ncbi:MAG: type II toxin-antitoxin system MqsA family antitoxin [candidate division KSB1 bacterium]|nr:type II toxin-antitoxin system MqsA family antitoxin [candidate division KSB1 bacterium]
MSKKDLCDFCEGELKSQIIDLDLKVNGELLIIENIPAEVCEQCGEYYLSAEVSEKIDAFIEEFKSIKPERYIPTPVYSSSVVLSA